MDIVSFTKLRFHQAQQGYRVNHEIASKMIPNYFSRKISSIGFYKEQSREISYMCTRGYYSLCKTAYFPGNDTQTIFNVDAAHQTAEKKKVICLRRYRRIYL